MRAILVGGFLAILLQSACSKQEEESVPRARPASARPARKAGVAPLENAAHPSNRTPVVEAPQPVVPRGALMGLLPKETILALRFPDLGKAKEQMHTSVLGSVMTAQPFEGLRGLAATLSERG